MDRLDEVVTALKAALVSGGVSPAVLAFESGRKMRYSLPVVTVGLKGCSCRPGAFIDYLGEQLDPDTQEWAELYGKRLEATFALDIHAPRDMGANECAGVLSEISAAVSSLPSGLRALELRCGETRLDETSGMFICRAELKCAVYLCAVRGDDGSFTDFRLRGVMISGSDQ